MLSSKSKYFFSVNKPWNELKKIPFIQKSKFEKWSDERGERQGNATRKNKERSDVLVILKKRPYLGQTLNAGVPGRGASRGTPPACSGTG